MHSLPVAEFKANLSTILSEVKTKGEEYIVEFGRNHEKVAVLIPYEKYQQQFQQGIKLGLFADTASVEFKPDFKMTDEQLLGL
jgi:prevent-host-death family protein